jgi:lipopolysaccharide exporter
LHGIPWTFLSFAGTRLLGVLTTLVLARLLVPNDFGLVAFAVLSIQFVLHFTGLGLGAATVARPDLDRRALGTVEMTMLVLGPLSAVLLLALSPLAGAILGEDRLVGVLAALTIPVVFGGLTAFYAALLQRELAFASQAACLLTQAAVASAVSIVLAVLDAGVWSIVVGQIAGAVAYTAALVTRSPFLVRPRFDSSVARDVLRTGRGFVLQTGFSFVEQNIDYAVVGGVIGARSLGAYSLAYRLSELPNTGIVEPVAQVTFPGFARMRHRSEDVSEPFLAVLRALAVVGCPICLLLAATADPFVRALLGEKWLLMVGPLSILGIWGAVRIVQATIAWMLNSVGFAFDLGRAYAALVVITAPVLVVAAIASGLTAVAAVMLANVVVTLSIGVSIATRKVGLSTSRLWRAVRPAAVAGAPSWLVARLIAEGLGTSPAITLAASVAGGSLTYLAVLLLADRRVLKELVFEARYVWSPALAWRGVDRARTPTSRS